MAQHYETILAVAGIITAMGIAGQFDYEEEQRQIAQYCEMVNLWKQTNGQRGWPAYDGEEACRTSNVLERKHQPETGRE